ncbi:MAG: acetylglutamate kinase [Hyphomicrobiales bacterium]|nr:acetylglutamate kinase [Hyphomicrobiales bacterium]
MMKIDSAIRAKILSEALPYMQTYNGKFIVVKYGGHAMVNDNLSDKFAQNIVMLHHAGMFPIVVHGGGPQIGENLKSQGVESKFHNGLRITDRETIKVVEKVLYEIINAKIVQNIKNFGGKSISLSGNKDSIIFAKKLTDILETDSNIEKIIDLGFVGEPELINPEIIINECMKGNIPVITPLGIGKDNITYNINADTAAGSIASSLDAKRLLMLTDVAGVIDENKNLINELNIDLAKKLIKKGVIQGGMIPKITTCIDAIKNGVEKAVILDGRVENAVILELFTEEGLGTLINN